jgi:hypothetical protein
MRGLASPARPKEIHLAVDKSQEILEIILPFLLPF